ncbi:hypothetical protein HIM_06340 [Hirsutella minnesotensis 3608]|uniref:Uncharacterized protein n=1 Tax=Hirsutella minnesotensis 3608 TaxID=1043627 RepID=A0A0F8A4X4_9HYPO|nr:hypothetical protein HIM_06340 [Hirsutella minnesotensis 3608]
MFEEIASMVTRVRIAAMQAEARSKTPTPNGSVVRRQRSKVMSVQGPDGSWGLAKKKVVRARRGS